MWPPGKDKADSLKLYEICTLSRQDLKLVTFHPLATEMTGVREGTAHAWVLKVGRGVDFQRQMKEMIWYGNPEEVGWETFELIAGTNPGCPLWVTLLSVFLAFPPIFAPLIGLPTFWVQTLDPSQCARASVLWSQSSHYSLASQLWCLTLYPPNSKEELTFTLRGGRSTAWKALCRRRVQLH